MGIFNFFWRSGVLDAKIKVIKHQMEQRVREISSERIYVSYYGAYEINPIHLVFWICVETDETKMRLKKDGKLNEDLRKILHENNYPIDAIDSVYIDFESQETVDRESGGDWRIHFQ